MNSIRKHQPKAVTLAELLVVLAIVSLLATLAVPVFVAKTEQARRAVARAEVRAIADAMNAVAVTHGYYVPMHVLDNQADLPSGQTSPGGLPRDDFENYPGLSVLRAINPNIPLNPQRGNQPSMDPNSTADPGVARMVRYWQGPFLQPTRVYMGDRGVSSLPDMTQQEVSRDIVLDPWGRPYRFYSPLGVVGSASASVVGIPFNATDVDNGFLSTNDPRFDRFAIVSYGPDGLSSTSGGSVDDDIWYEFGYQANESFFNGL